MAGASAYAWAAVVAALVLVTALLVHRRRGGRQNMTEAQTDALLRTWYRAKNLPADELERNPCDGVDECSARCRGALEAAICARDPNKQGCVDDLRVVHAVKCAGKTKQH